MRYEYKIDLPAPTTASILWEMKGWCEDQFGQRYNLSTNVQGNWQVFWSSNSTEAYTWYFKREEDAALFALRWA